MQVLFIDKQGEITRKGEWYDNVPSRLVQAVNGLPVCFLPDWMIKDFQNNGLSADVLEYLSGALHWYPLEMDAISMVRAMAGPGAIPSSDMEGNTHAIFEGRGYTVNIPGGYRGPFQVLHFEEDAQGYEEPMLGFALAGVMVEETKNGRQTAFLAYSPRHCPKIRKSPKGNTIGRR